MKNKSIIKIRLTPAAFFSATMLALICFGKTSYAQTAVISVKIIGGEFGIGQTIVLPDEGTAMNQALYTAGTSDGETSIMLSNDDIKYNAKEFSLHVIITLRDGKSPGNYTLKDPENTPLPPHAEVSVQTGDDEGTMGHLLISESGNVNVTAFGGPGNFMIGTFSGSFYEGLEGGKIKKYQVSGKFKAHRIANDEN